MYDTKNSFVLYGNFFHQFQLLNMEQRGELITAIFEYTTHQSVVNELSPLVKMAFSVMKDTLDRDRAAYLAKCEKNRENGKKGGRPRKNDRPKNEWFFEKTKKGDNDNGNDNENDNDIDNDTEWEKENPKEKGFGPDSLGSPNAPLTPSTPYAPQLSEQDREELKRKGVEDGYIAERWERAVEYAAKQRRSVVDVLASWWQGDRRSVQRKKQSASESESNKSYDLEEFFNAAVDRALEEAGNKRMRN